MTSKLTREKAQWLHDACEEAADAGIKLTMNPNELLMFTSYALAAMDSEPVVFTDERNLHHIAMGRETSLIWGKQNSETGDIPLYRHAQPAPVAQPMMFIDGDISSEDADKLAKVIREFNEEDERPLAKMARIIRENPHPTNECDMPKAQPAPLATEALQSLRTVVADPRRLPRRKEWIGGQQYSYVLLEEVEALVEDVWRAAMLQGKADGSLTNEGTKQSVNSPVITDGYVMVPKEPTEEMLAAAKEWTGLTSTAEVVYIKMLAAAPQEVKP